MQYKNITYLLILALLFSVFGSFAVEAKGGTESMSRYVKADHSLLNTINIQDTIKRAKKRDSKTAGSKSQDTVKTSLHHDMPFIDSLIFLDTLERSAEDAILGQDMADSLVVDTLAVDTLKKESKFIDHIIQSSNKDSLILDIKNNKLYLYKDAEVNYVANTMKADIIEIDIETNNIFAKGTMDTVENKYRRTTFKDKNIDYQLDSIAYNLKSEKGKIYGVFFEDAEGYVHGETVKKIGGTMNVKKGKYTSCDLEHPHFYLASTKAQYITSKDSRQVVIGPSYLVVEDVPIPLIIPFGFFPIMSERSSGIIIPTVGEENLKGFYLRDGGWYQVINDYWDVALTGGIYTLGSWNAAIKSSYSVRYKFNGNLSFDFANDKFESNNSSTIPGNMKNYKLAWTHTQDPKFRPGSSFSASVNFATSGYNRFDGNLSDYVSTQTNSSISYSKTWIGTPFSLSTNFQQSQNNKDSSVVLSLPNVVFNVSKIYPFRRKNMVGKQKWYEKVSLNYTATLNNTINTKEKDLFTSHMFDKMKYGIKHEIPVSTSLNVLKHFNISPNFKYTERWYFDRINREWDPGINKVVTDTTNGFYRVYDYSAGANISTIVYGMYTFKKGSSVEAIRHMMTPSIGFNYRPNFGASSYGYYKNVQVDSKGTIQSYSPYETGIYSVPGRGASASMTFSLGNNVEMKVRSKSDSTGVKKVSIFDSFNISTNYNFLADSLNLAPITITAQTTLFKSLNVNISASWDLYKYTDTGIRTKYFAWANGSAGRVTNFNITFGYSLRHILGFSDGASNTNTPAPITAPLQGSGLMGAPSVTQQQTAAALRSAIYYNFSIPWNLTMGYTFNMNNTGREKQIIQTLNLNAGLNLTPKWAVTLSAGVDLANMKMTPGAISIVRDLHCWQMSFSWVPIGFRSSWSFNINVKSSVLQDLKFKKSSSFLDNYYNN